MIELFCPISTDIKKVSCCLVLSERALSHGNCIGRKSGLNDNIPSPLNLHGCVIAKISYIFNKNSPLIF